MNHTYGNAPTGVMDAPQVVLPGSELFARRARRLRELSGRVTALGDFLDFMAQLAQAQQLTLENGSASWLPEPDAFTLALEHDMAPLGTQALRRDVGLREELETILEALELHVGEAQRSLLARLRALPETELDALADEVLEGRAGPEASRGLMPLVAAALQVAWTRMAITLPRPPGRPQGTARALCPSCGSMPAVSVIQSDPERSGVRYLQCGLCATQWYLERAKCSVCDRTGKLNYLSLESEAGEPVLPVQAETCGDCHGYLKIVLRELDTEAEGLADDLASLALDLLIAEEGRSQRSGYNPLLIVAD